jgi:putative transposase
VAGADRMTIQEVVKQVLLDEHADVIREAVRAVAAEMMELEVSEVIGAGHGERRPDDRATHRNGYRSRRWDTRAGELELQIPKLRQGSYFPSFLEPRKRSEQALLAVVQQAYVCGVSTRRVDQLVERLGLRISKSDVSRVCEALDEHVQAFRTRPLEGRYPYLFLDAKVEKVRDGGRVVNKALVIAHGIHETGRREILSINVGEAETETFWTEFLRPAGHLRRPRRLEGGDRQGPRLQLAALHRPLPPRLPRSRPQGPARPPGRVDPPDLQRRHPRAGPRPFV